MDKQKLCRILCMSLGNFTVTKHLLVAHSGGISIDEYDCFRTLAIGNDLYRIKRIVVGYSIEYSLTRLKRYIKEHPNAVLTLGLAKARIMETEDGNYKINHIDFSDCIATFNDSQDRESNLGIIVDSICTLRA